MKKNKILLCLPLCCLYLFSNVSKQVNIDRNTNVDTQSNIKINRLKYSSMNYGVERIMYEIDPKINNDEVSYSLKYEDKSNIESDIFEVLFMPSKQYIDITCLKPFEKRIILTIFAISNENIKASINIDFKEKISLEPTLQVENNSPLSVNNNLITTGGSIKVDKTIKNETVTFSNNFILTIQNKLKDRFENLYYRNLETTTYYQHSASYFGLSEKDCSYWFKNTFSYNDFLKSIYYEVNYSWIESDSDYESYEVEKVYVSDLLNEDILEIFNGSNSIFTYTCFISNEKYICDIGLNMDNVTISNIKILDEDVIF